MVEIDKSELSVADRNVPLRTGLQEFVEAVSMARPLFTFKIQGGSGRSFYNEYIPSEDKQLKVIGEVQVLQDGEVLGSILINKRYRSAGNETVFGVQSFRIKKERGHHDITYSKHMDVVMRVIKKTFIPRDAAEIRELLVSNVAEEVWQLHNTMNNQLRWGMDTNAEALFYARMAYAARKHGHDVVTLPSKHISVKNTDDFDSRCEKYEAICNLHELLNNKCGYQVQVREDGAVVVHTLEADSIKRYGSFDELPLQLQNKLAVFKVLEAREPIDGFGVNLGKGFFYITPDKKE